MHCFSLALQAVLDFSGSRRGSRVLLGLFLVFASGLLACLRPWTELPEHSWPCGFEAGRVARHLVSGHGYGSPFVGPGQLAASDATAARAETVPPTAWVTPPNVYLWTAAFYLFGIYAPGAMVAYLFVQILLTLASLAVLRQILLLQGGRRAAGAGLALSLLYPGTWYYAVADTHGTILFVVFLMLALWGLQRYCRTGRFAPLGLHALAVALAVLCEPSSLLFFAVWETLCGLAMRRPAGPGPVHRYAPIRPPNASGLGFAGTVLLAGLLVWGPWLVRNRLVLGNWAPFKSNLMMELYYGNNEDSPRSAYAAHLAHFPTSSEIERRTLLDQGEAAYSRICRDRVLTFVQDHPGDFVRLCAKRILWFWSLHPEKSNRWRALLTAFFWAILALWLVGRFRRRLPFGDRVCGLFLILYPVGFYLTHFFMYRYRHPLEAVLLMGASLSLGALATAAPAEEEAARHGAGAGGCLVGD